MNKPKLIVASSYAAILAIVFVVVITIWAELAAPLKDWLKAFSGHHWITKSILSVLLYATVSVILYHFPQETAESRLRKALLLLLASSIIGSIILVLFYTAHHFKIF